MQKLKLLPKSQNFVNLFIFSVFFLLLTFTFYFLPKSANAQVPKINLSCAATGDPEFNSLRPYQAAPCGDAPKARYCSNRLTFFEDFNVAGKGDCTKRGQEGTFTCHPNFQVLPHNLYVELDNSAPSQFPIMGNTEDVKNYQNATDLIDDAQKVNQYASWYLSGVNDKAENKDATDTQIVDYSGPVKKLLPSMIQDAQRIKIIESATNKTTYYDEDLKKEVTDAENHDQTVVDREKLSSWGRDKQLSILRSISNLALGFVENIPGLGDLINNVATDAWNKRQPPLIWDDGTATGEEKTPFKSEIEYEKAYNEWRGKSCIFIPVIKRLICVDNPGVTNKYADLWHYVPLANTSDKKGANYLLTDDGPSYDPSEGTAIDNAFHETYTNAPLFFAHTQEVMDLSELLNKTYTPGEYKSIPLPQSTEDNYCSAVEVRTNKGDDLFPGDTPEITVTGVQYLITEARCEEKAPVYECRNRGGEKKCQDWPGELKCNAEVGIILDLGTKTPFAKEIFGTTVADSGSTFRKIYPKVDVNAPVSCIADIPTTTGVIYDPTKSQKPKGGEQTFKVKRYPEDAGGGDTAQLTFPHIGSIYEYFLNGIQTALRPQGFGQQPISGQTCTNITCGELPKTLPKASGSCNLGSISAKVGTIPDALKMIVSAAAETYKVPPNLILGVMYGEGLFNPGRFEWSNANVKNWATCQKIPNCHESGDDNFMGLAFAGEGWKKAIAADLKKLDPTRKDPSPCNLMDAIYGVAWNLHDSADGLVGGQMPKSCFGIELHSTVPNSCTWNDNQYESAIKVHESGYTNMCFTKENSCATGGGTDAACETGGDTCETKSNRYANSSHNACVWDVGHAS